MDWDWKLIYGVVKDLLLLIALAYTWWSNREKVTARRFAALEAEVAKRMTGAEHNEAERERESDCRRHQARTNELETALVRIGAEMRNLPSRDEQRALSHDITGLTQKIGRLEGRLDGLNRVADLINEFLINQGGKKG